jgi:dihydrofolate reductase
MSSIKLIYAKSLNGAIGKDGAIPWSIPEDLARFKKLTEGHVVVMGRKTWESLPRKMRLDSGGLPNRINVILTRGDPRMASTGLIDTPVQVVLAECGSRAEHKNALLRARSLTDYLAYHKIHYPTKEIWIIGGESLYKEALPLASEVYETLVDKIVVDADAFAPVIAHKTKHFKPFRAYASDLSRLENSVGWQTSVSGERYCYTALERVYPMPSAEEQLDFYKAYGFPYVDSANGMAHSAQRIDQILSSMDPTRKSEEPIQSDPGFWAINLPMNRLPNGCDDGVLSFTLHAYTLEALYTKAKAHIDKLLKPTA